MSHVSCLMSWGGTAYIKDIKHWFPEQSFLNPVSDYQVYTYIFQSSISYLLYRQFCSSVAVPFLLSIQYARAWHRGSAAVW